MSIISMKGNLCQPKGSVTPDVLKSIGIIGSRTLSYTVSNQVGKITEDLIQDPFLFQSSELKKPHLDDIPPHLMRITQC